MVSKAEWGRAEKELESKEFLTGESEVEYATLFERLGSFGTFCGWKECSMTGDHRTIMILKRRLNDPLAPSEAA